MMIDARRARTRRRRVWRACLSVAAVSLIAAAPRVGFADGTGDGTARDAGGKSGSREALLNENHYYLELGPALAPDYEGSDDYDLYPLIIARWDRGGRFAELRGGTVRVNVIPASLFQAGPALRWHRKRGKVGDDRVTRLRTVDGALEAGGFVGVELRDPEALRRHLGLHFRVLQDVSGSHKGYQAKATLSAGTPLAGRWAVDVEAYTHYASGSYMDAYFSIDADNAARSGLRPFDASAGFEDAGFDTMVSYRLTDHWGLGLVVRYQRLLGDASDSPVVSEAGSADQVVTAITATLQY